MPRPIKELKGFEKVGLKKGEQKFVDFVLCKEAFSYYNPQCIVGFSNLVSSKLELEILRQMWFRKFQS